METYQASNLVMNSVVIKDNGSKAKDMALKAKAENKECTFTTKNKTKTRGTCPDNGSRPRAWAKHITLIMNDSINRVVQKILAYFEAL